jgi:hypothetical protein
MATRKRRPKASELRKLVNRFNAAFPVGTPVFLRIDNGIEQATRVQHSADVLQGHSAVAWFEGVRGAYSIDGNRVSKRPEGASVA